MEMASVLPEDQTQMEKDPRYIVVLGTVDILNAYLHAFLAKIEGWEILNLQGLAELDDFIRRHDQAPPDTFIVIHDEKQHCLCDLQMRLLQEQSRLKMVVINSEDNTVEIYRKQKILLKKVSDLVSLIEKEETISL
jgi:hypothetical protein